MEGIAEGHGQRKGKEGEKERVEADRDGGRGGTGKIGKVRLDAGLGRGRQLLRTATVGAGVVAAGRSDDEPRRRKLRPVKAAVASRWKRQEPPRGEGKATDRVDKRARTCYLWLPNFLTSLANSCERSKSTG